MQQREKEQLLEKSNIDQLTGLFSRQYLHDKYENAGKYAVRTALLFIDVDDLQSINDSYGHLVGDEVLKELAACIKNNVRVTNDAVRFGGDEFVIVLRTPARMRRIWLRSASAPARESWSFTARNRCSTSR